MKNPIQITILGWRRPKYLEQVLTGLKYSFGIQNYTLNCCLDGDYDNRCLELFQGIDWAEKRIYVCENNLGCNFAVYNALNKGFKDCDATIYLEDDTVITCDALLFFEWCYENYINDGLVPCCSGYLRTFDDSATNLYSVVRQNWLHVWSMLWFKDKFIKKIAPYWVTQRNYIHSWDTVINMQLFQNKKFFQAKPLYSRCQNIGAENGAFTPSAVFHKNEIESPVWIGNSKLAMVVAENTKNKFKDVGIIGVPV